jgi:hypothetical protein
MWNQSESAPLSQLPLLRDGVRRRRESSWDRTGANNDRISVAPGGKVTLADISGAGCITHIWMTMKCESVPHLREIVLRMYWDGEETPSVECPVGDFFGMGHGMTKNFSSMPLSMSPEDGRSFNCFFPMPFYEDARIEVENQCDSHEVLLYYYIDYETYAHLTGAWGRFHAQWRRENPCQGVPEDGMSNDEFLGIGEHFSSSQNLSGKGNYVILDAEGKGHYVGCVLNITNLRHTAKCNWYGEGDDMIFIDGDTWPPSLHGTGTEDYFNLAWCPTQEFSAPFHGLLLGGGDNWSGRITLYRFHIPDPVYFERRITVTIEHGHANRRSDDLSSVAYWYQTEPHKPFPPLASVKDRLP